MRFNAYDPVTGMRYSPTEWTRGKLIPPGGCRWCGIEQYGHTQRWRPSVGWHTWAEPTDAQRKARMKARRRERLERIEAFIEHARLE
jgi:hypothetical protein